MVDGQTYCHCIVRAMHMHRAVKVIHTHICYTIKTTLVKNVTKVNIKSYMLWHKIMQQLNVTNIKRQDGMHSELVWAVRSPRSLRKCPEKHTVSPERKNVTCKNSVNGTHITAPDTPHLQHKPTSNSQGSTTSAQRTSRSHG